MRSRTSFRPQALYQYVYLSINTSTPSLRVRPAPWPCVHEVISLLILFIA